MSFLWRVGTDRLEGGWYAHVFMGMEGCLTTVIQKTSDGAVTLQVTYTDDALDQRTGGRGQVGL